MALAVKIGHQSISVGISMNQFLRFLLESLHIVAAITWEILLENFPWINRDQPGPGPLRGPKNRLQPMVLFSQRYQRHGEVRTAGTGNLWSRREKTCW